ncbi:putative ABC transporter permease [Candidatus Galacturonibacter soehngenii]|uniref:ABC transporter permease n=1 Tax=Candidatus Galacturonatibacter soehngenii TaxID=2307010 RepID=A0A7V7QJ58_9FIRM|nr:hypothetical protein [Candidatus Galacturonibacter soehngenii]KAB1437622.1 hypothetical protein F7O84_08450 [Candidatus Galacturonibacter soehngenii]
MKKNFVICGIFGWCIEILWTAFEKFRRRDMKLIGNTSIWMFPIYGMASLFVPIYRFIKNANIVVRGFVYMLSIFTAEYITGYILKKRNMCPWDYSKAKYNINGLIRLDYAPLWFLVGLVFEKLVNTKN